MNISSHSANLDNILRQANNHPQGNQTPGVSTPQQASVDELSTSSTTQSKATEESQAAAEQDARYTALLDRLGEKTVEKIEGDKSLEEIFSSDRFLSLAEELSDSDLSKLVNSSAALSKADGLDGRYGDVLNGFNVNDFLDKLSEMGQHTRTRVLNHAAELANGVEGREADPVYDARGNYNPGDLIPPGEDLRNFTLAITRSEDPGALLDKLEPYSEQQQKDILKIMVSAPEQGEKLTEQLLDHSDDATDAILNALANISDTRTTKSTPPIPFIGPAYVEVGFNNNYRDVVDGMINQVSELLTHYDFSSEQIETMGSELNGMERSSQRAYLDITEIGLQQLVRKDSTDSDLSVNESAMEVVSNVRNDSAVRGLVTQSEFGSQSPTDFKEFEWIHSGKADQRNTISMLLTDAYLTYRSEGSEAQRAKTNALANNLDIDDAEGRRELINDASSHSRTSSNLSDMTDEELDEGLTDFKNRTATLSQISDTTALANLVEQIKDTGYGSVSKQKDQLYQVAAFAGENGDYVVSAMTNQDDKVRSKALDYMSTLATEALEPRENLAKPDPAELAGERMAYFLQGISQQGDAELKVEYIDKLAAMGQEEQLEFLEAQQGFNVSS